MVLVCHRTKSGPVSRSCYKRRCCIVCLCVCVCIMCKDIKKYYCGWRVLAFPMHPGMFVRIQVIHHLIGSLLFLLVLSVLLFASLVSLIAIRKLCVLVAVALLLWFLPLFLTVCSSVHRFVALLLPLLSPHGVSFHFISQHLIFSFLCIPTASSSPLLSKGQMVLGKICSSLS